MFDNIFNILTSKIDKLVKTTNDDILFDTTFQLPIFYTDKLQLSADIIKDLELSGPNGIIMDKDSINDGIYKVLFDIKQGDIFKTQMVKKWSEYYTTNVDFINDTIKVIKSPELTKIVVDVPIMDEKILTVWKDLKEDEYFLEKYSYMEWSYLENWNNSPLFLWLYACMNILSPIITILIPLIFFVFPVVLMVIFCQPFTFESYFTYLKELSRHHFIGNMIGVIDGSVQFSWDKIIGALVSILFYGISIYQNVISGYHFYNNMKLVNEHLITLRDYLASTNDRIETFLRIVSGDNAPSYGKFVAELKTHQATIIAMQREVTAIKDFAVDFKKCGELGTLLCAFYQFHKNPAFECTLKYTMGFNGYISSLVSLSAQYQKDAISSCTISKKALQIKKQYYPFLGKSNSVTNDITLDKNIILTGSNGCGKSTLMKTTLINVILSQQIGFGFYDSMTFMPYDSFHCYLNIIDTGANNDSLFMAQSRRSKDIMSAIVKGGAHLCILDEIFCGTEIKSCTDSCVAFINELLKNGDCRFILSTHIVDICKKRDVAKSGKVANYKMEVIESGDDIKNTYRLVPGISRVKGALSVFKNMDFPSDFIKYIRDNKNNIATIDAPPDAPVPGDVIAERL
jgi:energy-coupling factor transporter ATP-binding protein EcfA2